MRRLYMEALSSQRFEHTFMRPDVIETGTAVEVEIYMERRPAVIVAPSPFDPKGTRMRA